MNETDIIIEQANKSDICEIVKLKQTVWNEMDNKECYYIDTTDEKSLEKILEEKRGFILKATHNNKIIGFLIVILKLKSDSSIIKITNLEDKVDTCAELGNGAVDSNYRGYSLLKKMIRESEKIIKNNNYKYILSTVHPDNKPSLNSQLELGYEVKCNTKMYGNKDRCILVKEIKEEV